jgi:NhaC family Na+:H+ antiporter
MKKQVQVYTLLGVLIASITTVIVLKRPLYYALGLTTIVGWLLLKDRKEFFNCLPDNLRKIKLIMALMSLIGFTIPLIMASGMLPTLIYYMSSAMVNKNILLSAFLIATLLSLILGTAIGALTLIVPIFISLSIQGGVSLPLIVGALLSGAYFGDRASILSSSLHLVASVTETNYRKNIGLLFKSSIIPYALALIIYGVLGRNIRILPDMLLENKIIFDYYQVTLWLLLPFLIMMVLLLLKTHILKALSVLTLSSLVILVFRGSGPLTIINIMINGYTSGHVLLEDFIQTSGFLNMTNVLWVIFFSALLNTILEADHLMLYIIAPFVKNIKSENHLYHRTGWLSLIICMITCSQAMTAMITGKYMAPYFNKMAIDRSYLAMAISNVGVNLVALIPWNVNALMVLSITGVRATEYFIFAVFLWMLSLYTLLHRPIKVSKIVEEK